MVTVVTTDHQLNIGPGDPAWKAFEKDIANLTARVGAIPSSVKHDKKLSGVNSKIPRQVDVYVEGELSGIPIAIAIECKRYARKIDVGEMDAFVGKLRDLAVDKGVFYVHDGVTDGARNSAAAALHPRIVLREFAGDTLLNQDWDDLIKDCPNGNCMGGLIGWRKYPQPAGGADVESGYCDLCGTFAIRCRECDEIDLADYGQKRCYNCGATYDVVPDPTGAEVDDVLQLTRRED